MALDRTTVSDIAAITKLHPNTIRNYADRGIIESRRDFKGWRFFPRPLETVKRIQGLLDGDIKLAEREGRGNHM